MLISKPDSSALKELVLGCAVRDGEMVYQARSLYGLIYHDYTVQNDECMDIVAKQRGNTITQSSTNNRTEITGFSIFPNPTNGEIWMRPIDERNNGN